ncbi:AcrR family transcriptional regulator [Nakamurella sp. UYEF19]|uniref:TetR/AcrR family transcriptional regulator n=1 Tax=Nakamurella sp. UYEF19 TaxID=1756392 RepID=UPI003396799A
MPVVGVDRIALRLMGGLSELSRRILAAAAELAADRDFGTISMADIGAEAGIVGSGVYRHFESEDAILVALLDSLMDRVGSSAARIVEGSGDAATTLSALIADHIQVAIGDRAVLAVYPVDIVLPERPLRRTACRALGCDVPCVPRYRPLRSSLTGSAAADVHNLAERADESSTVLGRPRR